MQTQPLINLLHHPESVVKLSDEDWNDIVMTARQNQLLGPLAARLKATASWNDVPPAVRRHLDLELLTAQRRGESAQGELAMIRRTISADVDLILLKGCAYLCAGDANQTGRIFSDVDVMVGRGQLAQVESELIGGGWKPSKVDAYDDAYYRNWMHEVPPMEHVRRHTVLDLHHAINPPVARYFVNPALLTATKVEVAAGVFVLAPLDRVLHCAIHLIQEGEPKKLLRDLYDLHLLLAQHSAETGGIDGLLSRARELGIYPLACAAAGAASEVFHGRSDTPRATLLQKLLVVAAIKAHDTYGIAGWLAGTAVLVYSHWIKMPLRLLLPHLCRKSAKALFSADKGKNQEIKA